MIGLSNKQSDQSLTQSTIDILLSEGNVFSTSFKMSYRDNGIGFLLSTEETSHTKGIGIKSRTNAIDANFHFELVPNEGMFFELEL